MTSSTAKRPETQAFANEYRANMQDDENEFEHLNRDSMELDLEQPEQRPEMKEDEEDDDEELGLRLAPYDINLLVPWFEKIKRTHGEQHFLVQIFQI